MAGTVASWIARLAVAGMFAFTGVFKLSGNPDAQATFAMMGGDLVMYLTGATEVVGAVLILMPWTRALGGVLAMGVMAGAVASHLADLVPSDEMLPLAVVLFVLGGVVAWLHRAELPIIGWRVSRQDFTVQAG